MHGMESHYTDINNLDIKANINNINIIYVGSATFFHGEWPWNIFYSHSFPSADSRRVVFGFWRKNVQNIGWLLKRLILPRKSGEVNWPRLTWPHLFNWAVKPQHKQIFIITLLLGSKANTVTYYPAIFYPNKNLHPVDFGLQLGKAYCPCSR